MTSTEAKLNWNPVGERIIVRPDKAPDITPGGIHLPNANKDRPTTGVVILRGGKVAGIREGDHVMFSKYGGMDVDIDGPAILLHMDEVLCHANTGAKPD